MGDELLEPSDKKPWQSKTLWVALLVAIAPFYPPINAVVASNPELVSIGLGFLFTGLRLLSKDKIVIK